MQPGRGGLERAIFESPAGGARLRFALDWLVQRDAARPVLVLAATPAAAAELVRRAALSRGAHFGWQRATLGRLAAELAQPRLAEEGRVAIGRFAREALVARVLQELDAGGELGRFEAAARGPGLPRALAASLAELREAGRLDLAALAQLDPELAAVAARYAEALAAQGFADRAELLQCAAQVARAAQAHPLLGAPLLLLDVPLRSAAECELIRAVAERSRAAAATLPAGDPRGHRLLAAAFGRASEPSRPAAGGGADVQTSPAALERLGGRMRPQQAELFGAVAPFPAHASETAALLAEPRGAAPGTSLAALQAQLFGEGEPAAPAPDGSLVLFSAPGENRECVEIARRALALAGAGLRFDQLAVLLRSPEEYRPHLEEAFARAGIPLHFAQGVLRPDPAGRAFLALLACARDALSADRFAEYLSFGELPAADAQGEPPPAPAAGERWALPEPELLPAGFASALAELDAAEEPAAADELAERASGSEPRVEAGRLRAPRRWERLLVDAAVIGGEERWQRRLAGLAAELELDLAALEDPDDPQAALLRRDLADLTSLRDYALPLIAQLAALPGEALWGKWLEQLGALAARALRRPQRVLAVLAELAPMAPVGPLPLTEVLWVLEPRLQQCAEPAAADRSGAVFAAPAQAARGMAFEVVFVPGLAERLFPRKLSEDPTLLDALRRALGAELATQEDRLAEERLALRIALGAAQRQAVLSYPRLDLDQGRPRVPSFYALEALRAGEGRLPGFDELALRAETVSEARVGWPAPPQPQDAIDASEHDLALLGRLLEQDPEQVAGTARYLLDANPHLGRALRFRARRWLARWTPADGLVDPDPEALAALAAHRFAARSYSPTALQKYATCPYQFYLHAVQRLAARRVPERIEELGPLERGSLVHEVQFTLLAELRDADLLPLPPHAPADEQDREPSREPAGARSAQERERHRDRLAQARARLDTALDAVAQRWRDALAPAIERLWRDAVEAIRADLREWLRRVYEDDSGFVPWRFELSFGLRERRPADPGSVPDAVALAGGLQLRGSIDLVERRADGALRATDHKTGRERFGARHVVGGGSSLQPALYALALEQLFPGAPVAGGRLFYCTAAGGFAEHTVALDARARASAQRVAQVIGQALEEGFLPAAPAPRACQWCEYQVVCGPYEELRSARKPRERLAPLLGVRELA